MSVKSCLVKHLDDFQKNLEGRIGIGGPLGINVLNIELIRLDVKGRMEERKTT